MSEFDKNNHDSGASAPSNLSQSNPMVETVIEGIAIPTQYVESAPYDDITYRNTASSSNNAARQTTSSVHTLPPTSASIQRESNLDGSLYQDKTDFTHLVPFVSCCCFISSLYCAIPDCFGLSGHHMCCCVNSSYKLCKPSGMEKECCVVVESRFSFIQPVTCCMGQDQTCFTDFRWALPSTKEIPCMVTVLGLTMCHQWSFKWFCCKSMTVIDPTLLK